MRQKVKSVVKPYSFNPTTGVCTEITSGYDMRQKVKSLPKYLQLFFSWVTRPFSNYVTKRRFAKSELVCISHDSLIFNPNRDRYEFKLPGGAIGVADYFWSPPLTKGGKLVFERHTPSETSVYSASWDIYEVYANLLQTNCNTYTYRFVGVIDKRNPSKANVRAFVKKEREAE